MSESRLKHEIADYARRLHARGWVANHDGNLSARLGPGRYLATPTSTSKAEIVHDGLLVVDDGGAKVSGSGKPFSEINLHLAVYRARGDAQAVIHAHPPTATGFSVAGVPLDQPVIAEAVVSLGPGVPTVPFARPGGAAATALQPYLAGHDAVILANHGVLAWGATVEQAYLRLELVEHLARIVLVAAQLGGARPIPADALPPLIEARRRAGLGQAAAQAAVPSPAASVIASPSTDLAAIIRQELAALVK